MRKTIIIGILALLTILIAGCSSSPTGNAVADEEVITIPLSDLSETVQFYEYNDNGVQISYFTVLGSDEKPRTAFDACDVCGGYQGYKQQGSDIKCRNCGRVFSIDGLGTKGTGAGQVIFPIQFKETIY
ncbi:DUF2318 domain-containing protein [Candidatus Woesearchaeota archaeon]|nr:DUF2318 domain-containing protein [Candidatus Woesearchaeota archaeon]